MRRTKLDSRSIRQVKALSRIAFLAALLTMISTVVSAYTIVLRDGRRIEVSSEFVLTKTSMTYEVAPGINKTLPLNVIDIAATERATNEGTGGFFKTTNQ